MTRAPLVLLLLSVSLTGCFRGSNIKGDFACKAPGGTCAPMSTIDGEAIAGISPGGIGAIRNPGSLPPPSAPLRTVSTAGPDDTGPARTAERVLRVVFPAHIDRDGIYREESAAHAVVEPTQWAEALGAPAAEARRVPVLRQGGAVAAVPAPVPANAVEAPPPAASLLASMDEVVAAQAARRSGAAAAPAPAAAPIPSDVAPLRAVPLAGAVTTPFAGPFTGPSRAVQPMSLAEAAAGLTAPPTPHLEPAGPGNYDTPDVTAAIRPPQTVAMPAKAIAAPPAAGARPDAVMRTVRWKGKTYRIPVARSAAAPAAANTAQLTTAELNRRALARAGALPAEKGADEKDVAGPGVAGTATTSAPPIASAPSSVPSSVSGVPQPAATPAVAAARVRAMAAPQLEALATRSSVGDATLGAPAPASREPQP